MLEDGSFSDFDVVCGDTTFKAHKVILSRCPYFATAFSSSSGFKVCDNKVGFCSLSFEAKYKQPVSF